MRRDVKAITIAQPDANRILVSTIDREGVVSFSHTFERENGDFWCDEGKIWVPVPYPGWGFDWDDKAGFNKTTDGSLVAEDHHWDFNGKTVKYILWPAYITDEMTAN
jgi:hypothetical protein